MKEKVGALEKGSFVLLNLGNIPIMTLMSSFLLIYYVDVVKLNPAHVGTMFLLARLLDFVIDPTMGYIIDHLPKTKMGRFRPYIIIGVILCTMNYLMLWFGPLWFPSAKLFVAFASYFLMGVTFDLMDIPLNSMLPTITDDSKERNSLSTLKGIAYTVGGLVIGIAAPLILSSSATPFQGYKTIIIVASTIVVAFSIIGVLGVKERIEPISQEKYKLKDLLKMLVSKPVLITFSAQLFAAIASSVGGATALFFALYVLKTTPEILSVIGIISLVGALCGMVLSGKLSNTFGKKIVYSVGLLLMSLFLFARLISVTSIPFFYLCTFLSGIGGGLMISLQYGIQADNIDYLEHKFNQRAEGALSSINSFVGKLGQGIGGALPGFILSFVGYVPNVEQTPSAINGIIFVAIVLPGLCMLIAGLTFLSGYKLNKFDIEDIMTDLKNKRNTSNQ